MLKAPGKFAAFLFVALVLLSAQAFSRIHRSAEARREFMREHPCPATGKRYGACPGWIADHVNPLACGGKDSPKNMQWQTVAAAKAKDRWELRCTGHP